MPSRVQAGEYTEGEYSSHRLVIGTHVSHNEQEGDIITEPNQIQIVSVKMPAGESNKLSLERKDKFAQEIQINHPGEVNKARYMP